MREETVWLLRKIVWLSREQYVQLLREIAKFAGVIYETIVLLYIKHASLLLSLKNQMICLVIVGNEMFGYRGISFPSITECSKRSVIEFPSITGVQLSGDYCKPFWGK